MKMLSGGLPTNPEERKAQKYKETKNLKQKETRNSKARGKVQ
jgi:hypothetical protein